jgi:colanic acid/amylovoran/stewartan biosynthesis glycosyltransferase WcaL/AmsK/CpsK
MNTPTIAHGLLWYLPPTMGYIHDQLLALGAERSLVIAAHPWTPQRFPLPRVRFAPASPGQLHLSPAGRPLSPHYHELWRPTIRDERPALLHVHDGRLAPSFLPLAKEFGLPLVTTFLGRDVSAGLDDPDYLAGLHHLFDEGDRFIAMSQAMARQVERLGCPAEKIRVIHHGAPLSRFSFTPRHPPDDGPVVIATAGRLIPKKGIDDLARALVQLCRASFDVRLRIIGEGPMRAEIEAILDQAGVRDRAELLGYLEPEAVAAEMSGAHLFCLPSRTAPDGDSEGIPNTLKEAMASGLPVVSTYHAGIPELVEEGVSGYLVPEGDIGSLTDRLRQLIREPERWEPMGRAGRAMVEEEFALETAARQLENEVYQPLLSS